jgi:hypothetical protein
MTTTRLLLKLDRPDVSVEDFAEAAQALVGVLREVAGTVTGDHRPALRWVVRDLRAGSALLEAEPDVGDGAYTAATVDEVLRTAGAGMQALEDGEARPPGFSDAALRQAKRLAVVLSDGETGTGSVHFGHLAVTPTHRLIAAVDDEMGGKLKSLGAVEGTLLMVGKRDGYRFSVEDRVRGLRVECRFRDELLPRVLGAFEKRVSVRGIVWSRRDGQPTHVDVRAFEVLEDDAALPRARDVRGILRPIAFGAGDD